VPLAWYAKRVDENRGRRHDGLKKKSTPSPSHPPSTYRKKKKTLTPNFFGLNMAAKKPHSIMLKH
jgi:hypothetical protein